jgi:hypothetical protein
VAVGTVMTRLARCHAALHAMEDNGAPVPVQTGGPVRPGQEAPRGREWAA